METKEKKSEWDEHFEYWEKEVVKLRDEMLTPADCECILLRYEADCQRNEIYSLPFDSKESIYNNILKYELLKSKLNTSLSISRTRYLDKHRPLSEKFIDSIGKAFGNLKYK